MVLLYKSSVLISDKQYYIHKRVQKDQYWYCYFLILSHLCSKVMPLFSFVWKNKSDRLKFTNILICIISCHSNQSFVQELIKKKYSHKILFGHCIVCPSLNNGISHWKLTCYRLIKTIYKKHIKTNIILISLWHN
jgi:hypothetical protein